MAVRTPGPSDISDKKLEATEITQARIMRSTAVPLSHSPTDMHLLSHIFSWMFRVYLSLRFPEDAIYCLLLGLIRTAGGTRAFGYGGCIYIVRAAWIGTVDPRQPYDHMKLEEGRVAVSKRYKNLSDCQHKVYIS